MTGAFERTALNAAFALGLERPAASARAEKLRALLPLHGLGRRSPERAMPATYASETLAFLHIEPPRRGDPAVRGPAGSEARRASAGASRVTPAMTAKHGSPAGAASRGVPVHSSPVPPSVSPGLDRVAAAPGEWRQPPLNPRRPHPEGSAPVRLEPGSVSARREATLSDHTSRASPVEPLPFHAERLALRSAAQPTQAASRQDAGPPVRAPGSDEPQRLGTRVGGPSDPNDHLFVSHPDRAQVTGMPAPRGPHPASRAHPVSPSALDGGSAGDRSELPYRAPSGGLDGALHTTVREVVRAEVREATKRAAQPPVAHASGSPGVRLAGPQLVNGHQQTTAVPELARQVLREVRQQIRQDRFRAGIVRR